MKAVNLQDQIFRAQPTEKLQLLANRQAVNEQEMAQAMREKMDVQRDTEAQSTKETEPKELERQKFEDRTRRRWSRKKQNKEDRKLEMLQKPMKKLVTKSLQGGSIIDLEA